MGDRFFERSAVRGVVVDHEKGSYVTALLLNKQGIDAYGTAPEIYTYLGRAKKARDCDVLHLLYNYNYN